MLEPKDDLREVLARPWCVILYDDDVHDFEDVVVLVRAATAKPEAEARRLTLEAHMQGRSRVFVGLLDDCQRVARVLRRATLQIDVDEA